MACALGGATSSDGHNAGESIDISSMIPGDNRAAAQGLIIIVYFYCDFQ